MRHLFIYIATAAMSLLTMSACSGKKGQQENPANETVEKKIAVLSFDDGPNTTTTVQMLDMLQKHGVVGSFFVIGKNINEESARVMKRAHDMGCDIQNHSRTHSNMATMKAGELQAEIAYTDSLVEHYIGVKPTFFRPPYISVSPLMYESIGLPFICGVGCTDWEDEVTTAQRAETMLKSAADGIIFLLHDFEGNAQTVAALDIVIPRLKEQGYEFVTVSELFRRKGVTPQRGVLHSLVGAEQAAE
ncbi:MAG: polysaccharide deacetylase family protein [Bacteroides sp.]|nr:polysaccharide deacetylase family protein [Bacteroides sp.]